MMKTLVIALCATATVTAMQPNERAEFMRNGTQHAQGMSPEQRRAFMRDGHRHSQEYAQRSRLRSESFSDSDDLGELLNLARKLSLAEKKKANKTYSASEGSVQYNVKIKQKLKNSTGNINIGKSSSSQ